MKKISSSILILFILILGYNFSIAGNEYKSSNYPFEGHQLGIKNNLPSDSLTNYLKTINTQSLLVIQNNKTIYSYGDQTRKLNIHSIRKSLLSTLYGKYISSGQITLSKTMIDLELDDIEGLTGIEKKATIKDCLMARSGIYHPAAYETQSMKDRKPKRGQYLPGTFFSYNNWDFNVLGTIFRSQTDQDIFQAFYDDIALPLGMLDYKASDGEYFKGEESIHLAYPIRMSNRDLALFGQLMLHNGLWNNKRIVQKDWISTITQYHSDAESYKCDGYGYMWWVKKDGNKYKHFVGADVPDGTYSARGAGGHYLVVIPSLQMVISHRVDTDIRDNRVSEAEFSKVIKFLLNGQFKN